MSVDASKESEQSLIELMAAGAPAPAEVKYSWWTGKVTAIGDKQVRRSWWDDSITAIGDQQVSRSWWDSSVTAIGDKQVSRSWWDGSVTAVGDKQVQRSWWTGKVTAVGDRNIERNWSGDIARISTPRASSSAAQVAPIPQENRVDQTREAGKDEQAGCCQIIVWAVVIFGIYCMAVGGK